jgi:hypothetical protein
MLAMHCSAAEQAIEPKASDRTRSVSTIGLAVRMASAALLDAIPRP